MEEKLGMKELYDVCLKALTPIKIGDRTFETNETILAFDRIQMSYFQEQSSRVSANGGFNNNNLINWENTHAMNFSLSQGIFSKTQLAILNNSKIFNKDVNEIVINKREQLESDEDGYIIPSEAIHNNSLYLYNAETGEKLTYEYIDEKYIIEKPFQEVLADYYFLYKGTGQTIRIGEKMINGNLKLEAKTRAKEDVTGQTITGIITIPKLRLMSDLSIKLGENANPITANFKAVGEPVGSRGAMSVMEITFLESDIDSDL